MKKYSDSKNIKYDALGEVIEVSIPPNNLNCDSNRVNLKTVFNRLKLVISLILFLILSSILVFGYFYIQSDSEDSDVLSDNFHLMNEFSCDPFQPVKNVTVRLVEAQGYSCHDNTTCASLLRRIEQEQEGLRYNFVIGSDMELYIGLGFKCRVNHYFDELHIKVITPDLLSDNALSKAAFRVFHVIDEGLKCGNILQNYSVTYTCDGDETNCSSAVQYMDGIEEYDKMFHQSFDSMAHHTIHIPTSEIGIILHKAFRWTACGEASHEAKHVVRSNVITLESLPLRVGSQSCQPYKPVDQIDLYVVQEPNSLNCSDSSCSNLIPYIESQHDGFKYNFVVEGEGHLYVGLGFRCQGNQSKTTSLKIKLCAKKYLYYHSPMLLRTAEIIEEGQLCGNILNNYSLNVHLINVSFITNCYQYTGVFSDPELVHYFASVTPIRIKDFNVHTDSHVKIIPNDHRILACARKNNSEDSELSTSAKPVSTTTTRPHEATTKYNNKSTVPSADDSSNKGTATGAVNTDNNKSTTPSEGDSDKNKEKVASAGNSDNNKATTPSEGDSDKNKGTAKSAGNFDNNKATTPRANESDKNKGTETSAGNFDNNKATNPRANKSDKNKGTEISAGNDDNNKATTPSVADKRIYEYDYYYDY